MFAILRGIFFVFALAASVAVPALGASIDAGGSHSLLLRDDGTLWAWGNNTLGQLGDGGTADRSSPVQVLSGVKTIAAGGSHALAIRTDGTLWAWGSGGSGQLGDGSKQNRITPVQIMSGVRAIAAGDFHSLAVKTDNTLWAWGDNSHGQLAQPGAAERPAPVQVMTGVQSVAAGQFFSVAIKLDGSVWTWGINSEGELGDGTKTERFVPQQVMTGARAVAAGDGHTLVIKTDNTLWAWGYNPTGQVGDGTRDDRTTPVQVLTNVQSVSGGQLHSVAVRGDNTFWAWGGGSSGERGDGISTAATVLTPKQVLTDVQAAAAGGPHTIVMKTDGSLWAMGFDGSGQLGDASLLGLTIPTELLAGVKAVSAGDAHFLTLKNDGTLWAWGDNGFGQVGNGSDAQAIAPSVQVLNSVQAVAAGTFHSAALKNDGTLWTWGWNYNGQLGTGNFNDYFRAQPVSVLSGVQAIATGAYNTFAIKFDGSLWSWGYNVFGILGDGTTNDRPTPMQVMTDVAAAAPGGTHTLAVKSDGTLLAWGSNYDGQLGDGTDVDHVNPIQVMTGVKAAAAGAYHSLALKADGSLWAWGNNDYGQVGDGTQTIRRTPVRILDGVVSIGAAFYHSFAFKADGSLWIWGDGRAGVNGPWGDGIAQTTPKRYDLLRNLVRAATANANAIAVTATGSALVWGSNTIGQLGFARNLQSATPIPVRDPLAAFANSDLVVEYFNPTILNGAGHTGIGHYFITAQAPEAASIDAGGSGPGWSRTGRTFRVWNDLARAPAGAVGVCRFYARDPNSHFFTASAAECQSLKNLNPTNDPLLGWSYEGIAFYTILPVGGACPAGYYPVYRAYNNRFGPSAVNDSNHRITPSYNDYQRAIRFFGYADEGIAFCSPASADPGGDLQSTYIYPAATITTAAPLSIDFLYNNNGPGRADGGRIYAILPGEVDAWTITCAARLGTVCPPGGLTPDLLRAGLPVATWPAGGGVTLSASGVAPATGASGDATLRFAATAVSASGSPDSTPANDTAPVAQMAVKAAMVCNIVVNPLALTAGPSAQSAHVIVTAGTGCGWNAQSSAAFVTVSTGAATPAASVNGSGDATLVVTVDANPGATPRSATVTVAGQAVKVTQAGIVCTYTLGTASLMAPAAGLNANVALTTPADCAWTADSAVPWMTIAPESGKGSATLAVVVMANADTASRGAALSIGNQLLPVSQSGAVQVAAPPPPPPDPCLTLKLQRAGDQIAPSGITGPLSVGVVAETACSWRAESNAPWITLVSNGNGQGNGNVSYLVDANPDPDTRTGTITVRGALKFTINQTGNPIQGSTGDGGGDGGGSSGSGGSSGGSSG